jgi:hypothetical protein
MKITLLHIFIHYENTFRSALHSLECEGGLCKRHKLFGKLLQKKNTYVNTKSLLVSYCVSASGLQNNIMGGTLIANP